MVKNITLAAFACLLAVNLQSGATATESKPPHLLTGIAAAGASSASLIASATRAAFAHRDNEDYGYNYDISSKENAVAACFHAADREVRRKRRGLHARLDQVKKVKKSGERLKVTMLVTNFYRNGNVQRWIKCHVQHDEVVFLKYS
jgi:hypothetical protein